MPLLPMHERSWTRVGGASKGLWPGPTAYDAANVTIGAVVDFAAAEAAERQAAPFFQKTPRHWDQRGSSPPHLVEGHPEGVVF